MPTFSATLGDDNSRHCGIFFKRFDLLYITVFYSLQNTLKSKIINVLVVVKTLFMKSMCLISPFLSYIDILINNQ